MNVDNVRQSQLQNGTIESPQKTKDKQNWFQTEFNKQK